MDFWQHIFAQRAHKMKSSDIRDAFKLAERGDIISFAGGFPSPETFPLEEVADAASVVARDMGHSSLQYGPTEGLYELREWIARDLSAQAIPCEPEQVLVTNGSQQALDLVAKVTLDPGDGVIVEQPAYIGGVSAFAQYEPVFMGVPLDDHGLQTKELEKRLQLLSGGRRNGHGEAGATRLKLCYIVPNFQNPSGVSMSDERRRHLVELARHYGFAVIEDNPYGELRFDGTPKPHVKSYDTTGHVLYLGSFSKVFIPGFRLGYVVGPEPLIQKLTAAKQGTDLCSNSFGQRLIVECERRGLLKPHLKDIVEVYRRKRDLMLETLAEHFPSEVKWTYPEGGFFVWVTLPKGLDAKEILPRAVEQERVAYVSGGAFFTDGTGKNTIRLAYSQAKDEEIAEGIKRLGRVLKKELSARRVVEPASVLER